MMPLAPPRFSITNCWPNAWLSLSAQGRPMRSLAPPGAYGRISLTGRSGQLATCDAALVDTPATSVAPARPKNSRRRIPLLQRGGLSAPTAWRRLPAASTPGLVAVGAYGRQPKPLGQDRGNRAIETAGEARVNIVQGIQGGRVDDPELGGLVGNHAGAGRRAVHERHLAEEFADTQDGDRNHRAAILALDAHSAHVDEEDGVQRHVLVEHQLVAGKRPHRGGREQRALLGGVEEGKKPRGCRRRHHRELHGPGRGIYARAI